MDELRFVIKEIAVLFFIKCSKYSREQLNREFIDDLYDETIHEFCMMNKLNKSNEVKDYEECIERASTRMGI